MYMWIGALSLNSGNSEVARGRSHASLSKITQLFHCTSQSSCCAELYMFVAGFSWNTDFEGYLEGHSKHMELDLPI
jgi:hypothetical protein